MEGGASRRRETSCVSPFSTTFWRIVPRFVANTWHVAMPLPEPLIWSLASTCWYRCAVDLLNSANLGSKAQYEGGYNGHVGSKSLCFQNDIYPSFCHAWIKFTTEEEERQHGSKYSADTTNSTTSRTVVMRFPCRWRCTNPVQNLKIVVASCISSML